MTDKRILIVPLDWGLGHVTRCIPLIRELYSAGCEVLAAAEGAHALLLQQEFPGLTVLPLKGYRITYSRKRSSFGLHIMLQVPKICLAILHEHRWLKRTVKAHRISAVISDNRFGLYHPGIPSVFISHQLAIITPYGRLVNEWVRRVNYRYIRRYSQCWMPDFPGAPNLAGALSHPPVLPPGARYIGCLSRFEKNKDIAQQYELLLLLSGPEPQRTLFESLLLQQVIPLNRTALIAAGRPGKGERRQITDKVAWVDHLDAGQLGEAMQAAGLVISRAGYTTIMDIVKLGKKAILIPTPGQTEQEYLGRYLMQEGIACCIPQEEFQLEAALEAARYFPFRLPASLQEMNAYRQAIHDLVATLQPR